MDKSNILVSCRTVLNTLTTKWLANTDLIHEWQPIKEAIGDDDDDDDDDDWPPNVMKRRER